MIGCRNVRLGVAHPVGNGEMLVVASELCHVFVQGRREHGSLAAGIGLVEEAPNSGKESHVSHAVGFVDHHLIHRMQAYHALVDQVFESPGAGDQNLDTPAQAFFCAP